MRAFLACAIISFLCVPVWAADSDNSQAEQEIKEHVKQFVDAWTKHDPKVLAGFYTAEGDLTTGNGRNFSGRAQIEECLRDAFEGSLKDSTLSDTVEKVRLIKPDVAIVDSQGEISGGDNAEGHKFHIIRVVVKQDGKWLTETCRAVVYRDQQ